MLLKKEERFYFLYNNKLNTLKKKEEIVSLCCVYIGRDENIEVTFLYSSVSKK